MLKVLTEYIYEQYTIIYETSGEKRIQRVGSEQASIAVLIGGAGFSCRIGVKEWRVKTKVDLL